MHPETEFSRDPAFYAQDIICAVLDMADNFDRPEVILALQAACARLGLEILDIKGPKDAA